jgi:ubiquinone biosynthesis protein UbiJ
MIDWWLRLAGPDKNDPSQVAQFDAAVRIAQRMADVANESLRIAAASTNIETRESRLRVARQNLEWLLELTGHWPAIGVDQIPRFYGDLARLEDETDRLRKRPTPQTSDK